MKDRKGEVIESPEMMLVYDAILDYWAKFAMPPSLEDLSKLTGKSKTAVRWQVGKLRELEAIATVPGISRSIRPVGMTITLPENCLK